MQLIKTNRGPEQRRVNLHATWPRQSAKKLLQKVRLLYLARQDTARFSRTASLSLFDSDQERLSSRIMYNVHALEKGLARNHEFRGGFGRKALISLNDAMLLYRDKGYDTEGFPYDEGVAVLKAYSQLHLEMDYDVAFLRELINPVLLDTASVRNAGGSKTIHKHDKSANGSKNFRDLALGRSSVREFSGAPIDHNCVRESISIALKTPSVCNRQGWRVYWIDDKLTAGEVLRHQRGFGYREMPEVLLCVTVSNATFLSPVERNQGFVDGGLFAMSLLYALEYQGLAAVPLNACLYSNAQKEIRKIAGIADPDVIVMFIAIGQFPEECKVPLSARRTFEDVIIRS
ncbi:nitroreductase family protein [Glutamicibacter creatinolyticus]|uniref:nitroreductase family protein n=1 Tax=Glutamicibacter creatinolyticus TaxID=162496 RepID=UPI003216C8AA